MLSEEHSVRRYGGKEAKFISLLTSALYGEVTSTFLFAEDRV
jgi:hypothetical protein